MSHSTKTVVTLVHGTFARRAKWVQSSSLIYAELSKNLAAPVVITAFGWSGRNSVSARETAAEELANQLRQQLSDYPSAQHVLIGHSHGGNVALKAVMSANLSDTVRVSGGFLRRLDSARQSLPRECGSADRTSDLPIQQLTTGGVTH